MDPAQLIDRRQGEPEPNLQRAKVRQRVGGSRLERSSGLETGQVGRTNGILSAGPQRRKAGMPAEPAQRLARVGSMQWDYPWQGVGDCRQLAQIVIYEQHRVWPDPESLQDGGHALHLWPPARNHGRQLLGPKRKVRPLPEHPVDIFRFILGENCDQEPGVG